MADRVVVLIPLPGVGTLALSADAYQQALAEGSKLSAAPGAANAAVAQVASSLITADELGAATHMSRTTVYELAKAGRIPSVRIGGRVRFDRGAVLAALANGRTTDSVSPVRA
jgi:excisionase family DNA binding protein